MKTRVPSSFRKVGAYAPAFDLCGHDCGSGGGFDRGFAAEDGSGDERYDQADWQGLHEGVGHVDQRVLVKLLRASYGSDLRGDGSAAQRIDRGGGERESPQTEVGV